MRRGEDMTGKKQEKRHRQGKITQHGRGINLRLFGKKLLIPIIIAELIIPYPQQALADRIQKAKIGSAHEAKGHIKLDLPEARPAQKEEIERAIKTVLDGVATRFLHIQAQDSLKILIVNQAEFDEVEAEARGAIKIDDEGRLIINANQQIGKYELVLAICEILLNGASGFKSKTPFLGTVEAMLMPSVMASALCQFEGEYLEFEKGPLVPTFFFFVDLLGAEEFVKASLNGNDFALKVAYEKQFGAGTYGQLLNANANPWAEIIKQANMRGMDEQEVWERVEEAAKKAGVRLEMLGTD